MIVLGVHLEHDAGAALMKDGELVINIEAERVLGSKHATGLAAARAAVGAALAQSGLRAEDVDAVAYSDIWNDKVCGTEGLCAPRLDRTPATQAVTHGPRLAAELGQFSKLGFSRVLPETLGRFRGDIPVLLTCHSMSHAAGALYMAGFADACGLVFDAYGTCCGMMGYLYRDGRLSRLEDWHDRYLMGEGYHRIGIIAKEIVGTEMLDVAGKVMGLQAFGRPVPDWTAHFRDRYFPGRPGQGAQQYLEQATEKTFCNDLFPGGLTPGSRSVFDEDYKNLVASMQQAFTAIVAQCVDALVTQTALSNVFLSGGCAMNIIANAAAAVRRGVRELFVQPNGGDSGQAMGAAVLGMHAMTDAPLHRPEIAAGRRRTPYLGAALMDDPETLALPTGVTRRRFDRTNREERRALTRRLIAGDIVGLVQGRSEIGPRALGNRSILAHAAFPGMKERINQKIKRREWWRPFAPVCRECDAATYFQALAPSRYMLMNDIVLEQWRQTLASITHIDGTARVQVLRDRDDNPLLWDLLSELAAEAAVPILLNTSFNLSRKPLVNTAAEALDLLITSAMDATIVGDFLFEKEPGWIGRNELPAQQFETFKNLSEQVLGWTRGEEAVELARTCFALPSGAVVVEIGSFLGSSAILLAGARQLHGSGQVHCVDPFDGSGDPVSAPIYDKVRARVGGSLKAAFEHNMRQAGLLDRIIVHQGTASAVASSWKGEIDFLFLDGDQSSVGAREAYEAWAPFLKIGGIIALHNSNPREYAPGHEGYRRLVIEEIKPPAYADIRLVGTTTFARKA